MNQIRNLLWGNCRPNIKFWVTQILGLVTLLVGPFFLLSLYFSHKGSRPTGILEPPLIVVFYLLPFAAVIQHAVATFRAAKHASSSGLRAFFRSYPFIFIFGLSFAFLVLSYLKTMGVLSLARQSEAKIALAGVYGSEKAFFSGNGRYSSDFEAIGYTPEGNRRKYVVGIVACDGKSRSPLKYVGSSELIEQVPHWEEAKELIREVAARDGCNSNSVGFTAFAGGKNVEDEKFDLWRIDEMKVLNRY